MTAASEMRRNFRGERVNATNQPRRNPSAGATAIPRPVDRVAVRPWLVLSIAMAVVAVVASVIGLSVDRIYESETPELLAQALAQDAVNVAIVAPGIVITAVLALRGSLRAYLLWLGLLTFEAYNYVIYTVGIQFGPLFLVWVAILAVALYALIAGLVLTDVRHLRAEFVDGRWRSTAGWFLIVVGALFALLWLREIMPATIRDEPLESAGDVGWPSNIVHVLDLAFFLPAVIAGGFLLCRRHPIAYVAAPAMLVFIITTGLPIMTTPIVKTLRDESTSWAVVAPIGAITLAATGVLVWSLGHLSDSFEKS